jgi:hypothetical protein
MTFVITPADRASFHRCRRQWDFGAASRRNLEPVTPSAAPDLDRALRDAMAIYYYPGMWDWDRAVRLPVVVQGLERALTRQRERCGDGPDAGRWPAELDAGRDVLARYFEWAPAVDRFAPVLTEAEYEAQVLDPARSSAGLVAAGGEPVRYRGRIDLMAVDAADAYWIVRHRLVDGDWPPTEELAADEETVTACWAWEQFYIGMGVAGIIWNEMRRPPVPAPAPEPAAAPDRPRRAPRRWRWPRPHPDAAPGQVRQHEPSGGGRSIPQHRRMYAQARRPGRLEPVEQQAGDGFRRTWLRRSPEDISAAGRRLGADAAEMTRPGLRADPNPSDRHCPACPYLGPCQAMFAGNDPRPILSSGYRQRPPENPEEGRIGASGLSRGAAPFRFRGTPRR